MTNGTIANRLTQHKWAAFRVAAVSALLVAVLAVPAEARRRHGRGHHDSAVRHATHHRGGAHLIHAARRGGGGPAFAAIVVDANTGRTLYGRNENELRHPASITKVMTLYLLFEQLEKGRLRLDSPLVISAHAASQAPTKLGLPPGQTIDVENAIKAVVTKSANDIAVAIAENIAGDEDGFAELMTRKAHALGMSRTHYANASGLPNDEQITTARDLAVLGRAIQDRFPRYYRYFSTYSFTYRGQAHRNHNHLLGQIEGVDGIKTGYTRASGFNLLSSVRRNNRHIVAVVLGGTSGPARDRIMAGLIAEHIGEGDLVRSAHAITENEPVASGDAGEEEQDEASATPPAQAPAHAPAASPAPALARASVAPPPVHAHVVAPLALAPAAPPFAIPTPDKGDKTDRIRPAFVPGGPKRAEESAEAVALRPGRHEHVRAATDGSTNTRPGRIQEASAATTPPAAPRAIEKEGSSSAARAETSEAQKTETSRPPHVGWMIQIGATDDADKAQELLSRARAKGVPPSAKPFTEKVHKGKETLWRARFAGLEEKSAESACKTLKRSGFSCFATKN